MNLRMKMSSVNVCALRISCPLKFAGKFRNSLHNFQERELEVHYKRSTSSRPFCERSDEVGSTSHKLMGDLVSVLSCTFPIGFYLEHMINLSSGFAVLVKAVEAGKINNDKRTMMRSNQHLFHLCFSLQVFLNSLFSRFSEIFRIQNNDKLRLGRKISSSLFSRTHASKLSDHR